MHYVVVQRGWEYNDEYYYRSYDSHGDEGRPIKIFNDNGKAHAYCDVENLKRLGELEDLCNYWEDPNNMLAIDKVQFLVEWDKIFGTSFAGKDWWDIQFELSTTGATDNQLRALRPLLGEGFNDYVVVEVE